MTCTTSVNSRSAAMAGTAASKHAAASTGTNLISVVLLLVFVFFVVLVIPDIELGNSEVPSQIADVFGMNGADDVDDGEFLRIGDDDGEAADLPRVGLEIHVGIVAIPFTPRTHNARPAWSLQLRTEFFDVAVLILIAILEFETFDVHALQSGHQPLDIGFIRIPVGKKTA